MKKLLIFAALFVSLVILVVGVYLVISLLAIDADSKQAQAVTTAAAPSAVVDYATEKYPEYSAQYDAKTQVLRLVKMTDFSIKSAESVYDDVSTNLTQAQFIAFDISGACNQPNLIVELRYLSKDGKPMLSVASDGTITRHWE